jgi:hypothetical protein
MDEDKEVDHEKFHFSSFAISIDDGDFWKTFHFQDMMEFEPETLKPRTLASIRSSLRGDDEPGLTHTDGDYKELADDLSCLVRLAQAKILMLDRSECLDILDYLRKNEVVPVFSSILSSIWVGGILSMKRAYGIPLREDEDTEIASQLCACVLRDIDIWNAKEESRIFWLSVPLKFLHDHNFYPPSNSPDSLLLRSLAEELLRALS